MCRTNVAKTSGINMGIELYNKLPPVIKNREMTQEFKSRVTDFLMQHMIYSVEEFLSFYALCEFHYYYYWKLKCMLDFLMLK